MSDNNNTETIPLEMETIGVYHMRILLADTVNNVLQRLNIENKINNSVDHAVKNGLIKFTAGINEEIRRQIKSSSSLFYEDIKKDFFNKLQPVNIDDIIKSVNELKKHVMMLKPPEPKVFESLSRSELSKRLDISEKELLKLEKQKAIPFMKVGTIIRYNWQKVLDFLEKNATES